jgi:membrane-bound ClpP family serine protease
MSNTKRFAIILVAEFVLIVIGLVKVSITSQNLSVEIPNFRMEYMLGYSLPIVTMGFVAFLCCAIILREKKKIQITE